VDANAFFTMGKGMMHGLVPYRDLFEQKGPLLYLIYGLASLISYKTFLGGFIFEVIAFTFFLFYSYKSLALFIEKQIALILLPVMAVLILNMKAFTHGGSAEELCLPLLAFSLYHLLRYLRSDDPANTTLQIFFLNGLTAGCILWVKFSMLGFWLGWMLAFFIGLIVQKRTRQAFLGAVVFAGGMLAATIPWIIYFGINHAISDWINTYFVINLTSYSEKTPLINRLLLIFSVLATHFILNPISSLLLWLGIVVFTAFDKFIKSIMSRIFIFATFLLQIFGIFGASVGYIYYYLFFSPLIILGMIVVHDAIGNITKMHLSPKQVYFFFFVIVLSSLPILCKFNQNSYLLGVPQQDLVQYKFAEIINESTQPTLLNYGALDLGFYTSAGILPTQKYFELQNLDYSRYPLNLDEQKRYIREGLVEFVVFVEAPGLKSQRVDILKLNERYQFVASENQYSEGKILKYSLFKLAN
jgi:hypothetical protein